MLFVSSFFLLLLNHKPYGNIHKAEQYRHIKKYSHIMTCCRCVSKNNKIPFLFIFILFFFSHSYMFQFLCTSLCFFVVYFHFFRSFLYAAHRSIQRKLKPVFLNFKIHRLVVYILLSL